MTGWCVILCSCLLFSSHALSDDYSKYTKTRIWIRIRRAVEPKGILERRLECDPSCHLTEKTDDGNVNSYSLTLSKVMPIVEDFFSKIPAPDIHTGLSKFDGSHGAQVIFVQVVWDNKYFEEGIPWEGSSSKNAGAILSLEGKVIGLEMR
jgi:hypothetical protein